jgi:phosphopantothenoylcysteine decarboxylase / phosphopantothenate---cysteine ligase
MGTEDNVIYLLGTEKEKIRHISGSKRKLAAFILEETTGLLK